MENTFSFGQLLAYSIWHREGTLDLIQQEGNARCPTVGEGHRQHMACHQLHTHSICGDGGRDSGCELRSLTQRILTLISH